MKYGELIGELTMFGVVTRRDFRKLMLKHRRRAVYIDLEPLDAASARAYRSDMGDAKFYERVQRRAWFSWEGLARVVLELEFGDDYRKFADSRDAA